MWEGKSCLYRDLGEEKESLIEQGDGGDIERT